MAKETALVIPAERIQQCIYLIRKQKVMLDKDLAALYGCLPNALMSRFNATSTDFHRILCFS